MDDNILWYSLTLFSVSPSFTGPGKVPSAKVMTDGCGFANLAALTSIKRVLELDSIPTAVQCRVAGAKVCFPLSTVPHSH